MKTAPIPPDVSARLALLEHLEKLEERVVII